MLDLSYFQNSGNVNTQTFTNAGTWVTWQKPRGAKFVNITCIGSGAGGGGGIQTGSSVRVGGSGGASGALVRAQFQASILPDILYVYTGVGGAGGTGGVTGVASAGGNGERSFVAFSPDSTSASNIVVTSGAVSARAGQPGAQTSTNNPNTAGETVPTTANAIFLNLGVFTALAGAQGGVGGANGGNVNSLLVTGGAGGAGTGNAGNILANGPFLRQLDGGLVGSGANNATSGANGYMLTKPILGFIGGAGGGGIAAGGTGNAGNGGNGSWGSGGGGGGSSGTGTAGNGGRGGDGIIIITTSF